MSAEVANNPVAENKPEDAQPDANTASAEKIENTDNTGEVTGNAQENAGSEKQASSSNETKKENELLANKSEPSAKHNVHKTNFEKDVIYLYQFSRTPLLPSLSPYCLKVETWLRLAGLKYENVDHKMRFRSKKGQLPFIELNGEEIADSAIIIKELSAKHNKDLDAGLTTEQRNVSYAMIAMLENHLIWIIFYWRAKYPDNVLKGYKVNLQHALGLRLPNSILNFFFKITFGRKNGLKSKFCLVLCGSKASATAYHALVTKIGITAAEVHKFAEFTTAPKGTKKLKAHGIGVHSAEEIEEFGKNDLKVLSEMLDCKPFFFGDEPTTLDVVAFAVLSQLHFLSKDVPYALRDFMTEKCPNLVGHVSRMKDKCFPDWDEICTKLDLNAHIQKPEPENKEGKEEDIEKVKEQEIEIDKNEKELEKDNN